ncbi:glycine cleavage system protein H [Candidatus Woesearchaeota archaeon]|nr:glycine cleavage system protein H [Candidatus Woesearchaeota archaeon]
MADKQYTEENSWVKVEGEIATVGITEEAAKQAKEFMFIELPEKGKKIAKGEKYVTLEAVKWSGHVNSPVTGKIVEVNDALFDDPSVINNDPKGSWIMKVKID